ncbi:MAG: four helix bundle protein [Geothermobacteraceae bacterium]
MGNFRELKVWRLSKQLAVDVYQITGCQKIARDNSLCDQLRRAAVSVPSNIAEGDERYSDKEAIRFFYIAKGSLAELATQLEIGVAVGLIDHDKATPLLNKIESLGKMLGKLISSRKQKEA